MTLKFFVPTLFFNIIILLCALSTGLAQDRLPREYLPPIKVRLFNKYTYYVATDEHASFEVAEKVCMKNNMTMMQMPKNLTVITVLHHALHTAFDRHIPSIWMINSAKSSLCYAWGHSNTSSCDVAATICENPVDTNEKIEAVYQQLNELKNKKNLADGVQVFENVTKIINSQLLFDEFIKNKELVAEIFRNLISEANPAEDIKTILEKFDKLDNTMENKSAENTKEIISFGELLIVKFLNNSETPNDELKTTNFAAKIIKNDDKKLKIEKAGVVDFQSSNCSQGTAVMRNLEFLTERISGAKDNLESHVLSFSVFANNSINGSLCLPVEIIFRHKNGITDFKNRQCEIFGINGSDNPCRFDEMQSTLFQTVCICNHTSVFAAIFHSKQSPINIIPLKVVESLLSIPALIACLIAFSYFRTANSIRDFIHFNLCLCLLVAHFALIVIHLWYENNPHLNECSDLGPFFQLIILSQFSWMVLEGVHLMRDFTVIFQSRRSYAYKYLLIGYGIPVFFVIMTRVVKIEDKFVVLNNICWFHFKASDTTALIIGFFVPVSLFISITLTSICVVLWKIESFKMRKLLNVEKRNRFKEIAVLKTWTKDLIILMPLLGTPWCLGPLIYMDDKTTTIILTVTISLFCGLQGPGIFYLHVLRNKTKQAAFKLWMKKHGWSFGKKPQSGNAYELFPKQSDSLTTEQTDLTSTSSKIQRETTTRIRRAFCSLFGQRSKYDLTQAASQFAHVKVRSENTAGTLLCMPMTKME